MHVSRGDAQPLRQIRPADLFGLFGLDQLDPGQCQLGLCTRVICSCPQLVLDKDGDGIGEDFLALHIRASSADGLSCGSQLEERVSCLHADV